jgi:hypothetical protein
MVAANNACENKNNARKDMAIDKAVRERRTVVISIPLFFVTIVLTDTETKAGPEKRAGFRRPLEDLEPTRGARPALNST